MYGCKCNPGAIQLERGHHQQTLNVKLIPVLALFNLGGAEIVLIHALALIHFGAQKLPELARDLGTGIKEFRKVHTSEEITHPHLKRDAAPYAQAD